MSARLDHGAASAGDAALIDRPVSRKPLVYIASPYTLPDPVENTHRAVRCATDLLLDGRVTPLVPHLSLFWHAITPLPYRLWLAYDLELLRRCDAVLRLPGPSEGADREVRAARQLGIPVFDDIQALLAWAQTQQGEA